MTRRIPVLALAAVALAAQAPLPQRTQSIGVPIAIAAWHEARQPVSAVVTLQTDQAGQVAISARFEGWVEQAYVNAQYQTVRAGQPLCVIYSPALYAAEQDYVFVRGHRAQLRLNLADAVDRLRQAQVPEAEIVRLQQGGAAQSRITVTAAAGGRVTEYDLRPGQHVAPGQLLYRLASLAPIWAVAQVDESALARIQVGQAAQIQLDAFPGRSFPSSVALVAPQVDPASHAGCVRFVLPNRDATLAPGMYGRVEMQVALGRRLEVPASAVLQTGARTLVFLVDGDGELRPRAVQVGPQLGDEYVITSGLEAGTRVAADANFLLDSQAQLAAAAGSYAPPAPGVGAHAAAPTTARLELTTAPSPPRKGTVTFRVRLTSAAGQPLTGAQVQVTLYLPAMPAMGMAAMRIHVPMAELGGGLYQAPADLPAGGNWKVTVSATRHGQALARLTTAMHASGGM